MIARTPLIVNMSCYSNISIFIPQKYKLRDPVYRFQHAVELHRFYIHPVDNKAWAVLPSGMIASPASSVAQTNTIHFPP